MDERKRFSGEYWNLHRNSLLFSAALFVLSISKNPSDLAIFGLKFNGVGSNVLIVLIALAATYAVIAFFFEWKEDCFPSIQLNAREIKAVNERIKEVASFLEGAASSAKSTTDSVQEAMRKYDQKPEKVPEFRMVIGSSMRKLESDERQSIIATSDDRQITEGEVEEIIGAVMNGARALESKLYYDFDNYYVSHDDQFYHRFNELKESVEKLNRNINQPVEMLRRIRWQFVRPVSWDVGRSLIVAGAIPLAVYIVAISHALWQLGCHWFGSCLVRLLRSL